MAFLLSPKTGEGAVSYALTTSDPVSINGGAAQSYTDDAPGTVHPGDVLTPEAPASLAVSYWDSPSGGQTPIKEASAKNSYTVEDVAGAVAMYIDITLLS